jgi:hypothetical protein
MAGHQVEATFYALVEARFGRRWDSTASKQVDGVVGVKVTQILQKRPAKPKGVCVKLTLRFNEQAFMPLAPAAVIDIPDSLVLMGQDVEVEAEDENDAAVAEYLADRLRGA